MKAQFTRTNMLLGEEAMNKIFKSRVAIFGIGGVGGYVTEALARTGIGHLDLIDSDKVDITNLNRQIIALHSTVGRCKTDVAKERISDINPDCDVRTYNLFFSEETKPDFDFSSYDYIVDAIDSVESKFLLIKSAKEASVPIIAAMGAGNKMEASMLEVADISKTSVCPLARVMRRRLRDKGIEHLPVVYSEEKPAPRDGDLGTLSYVPGSAGLTLAGYVIRSIVTED